MPLRRQTDRIRKLRQQRKVTEGLLQHAVYNSLQQLWQGLLPTLETYARQRPGALQKGDVVGHEFHGNQWTAGGGRISGASPKQESIIRDELGKFPHNYVDRIAINVSSDKYHATTAGIASKDGHSIWINKDYFAGGRHEEELRDVLRHEAGHALEGQIKAGLFPGVKGSDLRTPAMDIALRQASFQIGSQYGFAPPKGTDANSERFAEVVAYRVHAGGVRFRSTLEDLLTRVGLGLTRKMVKGDILGHEFHGNQYATGEGGVKVASAGFKGELKRKDALLNTPENLARFQQPKKLYHVTSRQNAERIKREGFTLENQRTTKEGQSAGIYFTTDPQDLYEHQGADFNIDAKDAVVIEVDASKVEGLRLDPEYFYYNNTPKDAQEYIDSVNAGEDMFALYTQASVRPGSIRSIKPLYKVLEELGFTKHLPGQHDQQEHGNRLGTKETAAPKLIEHNAPAIQARQGRWHKLASQTIREAHVGHMVKEFELQPPAALVQRMRQEGYKIGAGQEICGYYNSESKRIVLSSTLTEAEAKATILHEVGHAVDHAYPSMRYEFFDYLNSNAPEERLKMQQAIKELGYKGFSVDPESFAEFHAVVNTPAGRKAFPKSAAWLRKGGGIKVRKAAPVAPFTTKEQAQRIAALLEYFGESKYLPDETMSKAVAAIEQRHPRLRKALYTDLSSIWEAFTLGLQTQLRDRFTTASEGLASIESAFWEEQGETLDFDSEAFANDYAESIGSRIQGITDTTRRDVSNTILNWYNEPEGTLGDLVSSLEGKFGESRAANIAMNETTALNSAVLRSIVDKLGVSNWRWNTMQDEIVCTGLIDGPDGVGYAGCRELHGKVFAVEDLMPPDGSHIGCRCTPSPVRD